MKTAKQIFDFYVNKNPRFACHWVDSKQHWYICPGAVMAVDTKESNTKVASYEGKPVSDKLAENPSLAYPESFLDRQTIPVTKAFLDCFWLGSQVLSTVDGTTIDAGRELPARHFMLLCNLISDNWEHFTEAHMMFQKKGGLPLLRLSFKGGQLFISYGFATKPETFKFAAADGNYIPSQWSDEEKCYKKIRKEKKMNLNPEKLVKDVLNMDVKELKFDPSKAGKENDGTEGITLEEASQTVKKEVSPAVVEEKPAVEESPAEAPAKEEPVKEEPVKRTRKKAETTPVNDLTKIIDQLSGAVPELTAEEALKAVRQLRDLQLAAARRAANISLQYIESTQGVAAKLAAIKAAL